MQRTAGPWRGSVRPYSGRPRPHAFVQTAPRGSPRADWVPGGSGRGSEGSSRVASAPLRRARLMLGALGRLGTVCTLCSIWLGPQNRSGKRPLPGRGNLLGWQLALHWPGHPCRTGASSYRASPCAGRT